MSNLLGSITHNGESTIQRRVSQKIGSNVFSIKKPQGIFQSNRPIVEKSGYCISGIINWFSIDSKQYKANESIKANHLLQHFLCYWIEQKHQMLKFVDGEFALIIWKHASQELWAIRDIFGSQPLHYFGKENHLAFASNACMLWSIPPTPLKINDDRILDFIVDDLEHADQTSTFKQGIFKTPIGSITHWKKGKLRSKQYWTPKISGSFHQASEDLILEKFQEHLRNAISKSLPPNTPAGLALSGGLDSNTILTCWPPQLKGEDNTDNHLFSLIPEKGHRSDPESAMLLSRKSRPENMPHHWITPKTALEQIGPAEDFVHALEDPFAIHSLSGPAPCYKMASKHGIVSVIDGIDGDMVAGIPSKYWRYLYRNNQITSSITECISHYRREGETVWGALYEISKMVLERIFPKLARWKYSINSSDLHIREEANDLLKNLPFNRDKITSTQLTQRIKLLKQNQHPSKPKTIEESILNGLKSPMLAVAVDRYRLAAEYCQVKAIHPLLDRSLVEFLLGLQWKYRVCQGAPKHLFRQQLRKKGVGLLADQQELGHVGPWFTDTFMRDYINRHPKPNPENLDALSNYVNITSYLTRYSQISSNKDLTDSDDNIWGITMLSEWLIKNG